MTSPFDGWPKGLLPMQWLQEWSEKWRSIIQREHEQLEAIRNKVGEWDETHDRDRHAAPSILDDLEKILEIGLRESTSRVKNDKM